MVPGDFLGEFKRDDGSVDYDRLCATYPLPDGVDDQPLSQELLAQALNSTVPTITKWRHAGMPVLEEGARGRAYTFSLAQCYAWDQARQAFDAQKDESARLAAQRLQAHFLGAVEVPQGESLDPKTRREIAQADLVWNQAARLRGDLVPVEEVKEVYEDMLVTVRAALDGLADRLGRELSLTPTQEEAVTRAANDCLAALQTTMSDSVIEAGATTSGDQSWLN